MVFATPLLTLTGSSSIDNELALKLIQQKLQKYIDIKYIATKYLSKSPKYVRMELVRLNTIFANILKYPSLYLIPQAF